MQETEDEKGIEMLRYILNHREERKWTEWELAFLDKVEWLAYHHLTRRQKGTVGDMYEKLMIGEGR